MRYAASSRFSEPIRSTCTDDSTFQRNRAGQEHFFQVDIAGHPGQEHVRTARDELRKVRGFFKILGTCPVDVH